MSFDDSPSGSDEWIQPNANLEIYLVLEHPPQQLDIWNKRHRAYSIDMIWQNHPLNGRHCSDFNFWTNRRKHTIYKLCCLSALFQFPVEIMIDKQNIWKWGELTQRENPLKSGRQCNWLFLVELYNMSNPQMLHNQYTRHLINQRTFLHSLYLKIPFY